MNIEREASLVQWKGFNVEGVDQITSDFRMESADSDVKRTAQDTIRFSAETDICLS